MKISAQKSRSTIILTAIMKLVFSRKAIWKGTNDAEYTAHTAIKIVHTNLNLEYGKIIQTGVLTYWS